jgi:DNA-binding GntR family transcriptional regulator
MRPVIHHWVKSACQRWTPRSPPSTDQARRLADTNPELTDHTNRQQTRDLLVRADTLTRAYTQRLSHRSTERTQYRDTGLELWPPPADRVFPAARAFVEQKVHAIAATGRPSNTPRYPPELLLSNPPSRHETLARMTSRSEPPTIREPRYAQIARDLAADIAAQRWAVGERMPAEPALATSFQVSRETLRNALRQTEAWGLVTRRKGDGTRVVRRTPTTRFDTSLGTLEELVQFGRDAVREVCGTDQIEVDCELARLTGLPAGASLTRLTTIRRTTDGAAVAWTQIYLDPGDAAAVADDLGRSSRLVSDLITERTGRSTHRVMQTVRAIPLPTDAAAALGLETGSPALEFVRRYFDEHERLFETAVGVHPGDSFSYSTTLVRSAPR